LIERPARIASQPSENIKVLLYEYEIKEFFFNAKDNVSGLTLNSTSRAKKWKLEIRKKEKKPMALEYLFDFKLKKGKGGRMIALFF